MKILHKLTLAAAAVLVAACAGNANRLTYTDHTNFYSPHLVRYVSQKGYFPVTIHGEPFGADGSRQITENLTLPGSYEPVPFRKAGKEDIGRLVLFMDGKGIINGRRLCEANEAIPTDLSGGEKIRVQAAFCYQDEMVSETVLTAVRPNSADDPKFQRSLTEMTEVLFRTQVPNGPGCRISAAC